ncbi:ATP-binding protein [Nitrincola alkalisediminis]|uniref:ATP-binding protein n=1 Tax=Nitrincola alkalisediminis TaxID=1366656 RepID=UPI0018765A78|nr:transporter substrate-binding domain-containing protein [Nitrincola alkalisediminis]
MQNPCAYIKFFCLIFFSLILSFTATANVVLNEQQQAYLAELGPVKMCVDPDWEPYERLLPNGDFVGIAADLIQLIAQRTGVDLSVYPTDDWNHSLQAAQAGDCHVVAFLNKTEARSQWLLFTEPYFNDPNVFITHQDHEYIPNPAGLVDKVVVLPKGTSIEEFVRRTYPNLVITVVDTEREAVAMVEQKKADMTIRSLTMAAYTIRQQGLFNLKVSGLLPNFDNHFRIGVLQSEPYLRDILDLGVATISPQEVQEALNRHVSITVYQGIDYSLAFKTSFFFIFCLVLFLYWNQHLKKLNHALSKQDVLLKEKVNEKTELVEALNLTRLRLENALKEEHEARLEQQQFMRMVTHEFRTPLTVIQTGFELLALQTDPEQREKTLQKQSQATSQLIELVNNALVQDRFENSAWRQHSEWIETEEIMRSLKAYAGTICSKSFTIDIQVESKKFLGDKQLLLIALNNLVDNAVKYSPQGGRLQLSAGPFEQGVLFRVKDQGIGIPIEHQSTIFGKYQRGAVEGVAGFGLGLYIVQRIVYLHKGRIELISDEGRGSEFKLWLPLQ